MSWVSWLRSDGRVPERDLEARLMEVTNEPSQPTPVHLQKLEPDQPEGVGERESESLVMIAASSATVGKKREKIRMESEKSFSRSPIVKWLFVSLTM